MKKVSLGILACFVFIWCMTLNAQADMGRIYVSNDDVTVSEDAQKAIILHNLREEVLILGTDLKASKKTGIIRFIPFPSEPSVSLAPAGVFEKAAAMIKKYGLTYQHLQYSKGGSPTATSQGVELRLNKKLGAHDLTLIKVNDVATFRQWVNRYFKARRLPVKQTYPEEEAIVADYVKRGLVYFVLDFVEISPELRFIEPVAYTFKSTALYYPLKTSNTFGGQGSIELVVIAPATLCSPGNGPFDDYSDALYTEVQPKTPRPYNKRPYCLNIPVKASTSALLVKEERDLEAIYPLEGEGFFKGLDAFIQVISYTGDYFFTSDIFVDLSTAKARALGPMEDQDSRPNRFEDDLFRLASEFNGKKCSMKPERGPCKGNFERYYYDSQSRTCKPFVWGGCGGAVPFETMEECNNACGPALTKVLEKTADVKDYRGMEWKGSSSFQQEKFTKVVTTDKEWADLWKRAFDKPAPAMDFERYAVACVFLGYSADWLYSIGFDQPFIRENKRVIPYYLVELILELSAPFKAHGQYHMKVFEKTNGVDMVVEEVSSTLGIGR